MSSVSFIELDVLPVHFEKMPSIRTISNSHWNQESLKSNKKQSKNKSRNSTITTPLSPVPENQVSTTFFFMRSLLQILGRFPFQPTQTSKSNGKTTNENNFELNSSKYSYTYSIFTVHWIYFFITTIFLISILCLISMGFTSIFLEWDFPTFLSYPVFTDKEKEIFDRNLVPFVLFWSCLIHSTVGSMSFILHRKEIVDYLNEWEVFVNTLNLQLPRSIRNFLLASNLWYFGFLVGVIIFHIFKILPIAVGGAELIVILCGKPFKDDVLNQPWFWDVSILAIITLVYSMYSSRALLFLYGYKCRLLKYAFKIWNKQLNELLTPLKLGESSEEEINQVDEEDICQRLYKEHFMLTTMVRLTDKIFGGILQSYYGCQILNLCFELYYLARSGKFPSSESGTSQGDIAAAILLLVQNIYIFFVVSLDAAYVNDEAQRGVEILRAAGYHPNDSIHKKYLVSSLHASFHHRIVMTGGKFFAMDRPFIITVLGAVCTYFVIILQYGDNIQSNDTESKI